MTDQSMVQAAKIWLWAVGACNQGDLSKVNFRVAWDDYGILFAS